jgi:hypothetical protein
MTRPTEFDERVRQCLAALAAQAVRSPPRILQIGAGDGRSGDFLHEFLTSTQCSAVLLEPVAHVFDLLTHTYRGYPSITCRRIAVSAVPGERILYRVSNTSGLPWWADQLASFDKNVVLSHSKLIPNLEALLTTESVWTVTPANVLTEGHDDVILSEFLKVNCIPQIVIFEHKHLSPSRTAELEARLREHEFELTHGPADTIACHRGFRAFCLPSNLPDI